ncbi:hypothetical protein GOP47_0002114 [Adiantum capillus-veneris]|uniref:Uncharacterized protein n=1 Tax=Adiantum capillus-veneris TaxID=13818 RepID=A0A9D4VAX3_ADICA|nr:hypothetical protein GOP47_0002114 [Adiantum capillus-veneris]
MHKQSETWGSKVQAFLVKSAHLNASLPKLMANGSAGSRAFKWELMCLPSGTAGIYVVVTMAILFMVQTSIAPVGDARSLPAAAASENDDQQALQEKAGAAAHAQLEQASDSLLQRVLLISVHYAEPKPNKSHVAKGSTTPILQSVDRVPH